MDLKKKVSKLIILVVLFSTVFNVSYAKSDFGLTRAIQIKEGEGEKASTGLKVEMKDATNHALIFFVEIDKAEFTKERNTTYEVTDIRVDSKNEMPIVQYTIIGDKEMKVEVRPDQDGKFVKARFILPIDVELNGGDATVLVDGASSVIGDMSPVVFARTCKGEIIVKRGDLLYDNSLKTYKLSLKLEESYAGLLKDKEDFRFYIKLNDGIGNFPYSTDYTLLSPDNYVLEKGFSDKDSSLKIWVKASEKDKSRLDFKIDAKDLKDNFASGRIYLKNIIFKINESYTMGKNIKVDIDGNDVILSLKNASIGYLPAVGLQYITIDEGMLYPSFSPLTNRYRINLDSSIDTLNIDGIPLDREGVVVGGGEKKLQIGENIINLTVKGDRGENVYTINAIRGSNSVSSSPNKNKSSSSNSSAIKEGIPRLGRTKFSVKEQKFLKDKVKKELPYTFLETQKEDVLKHLVGGIVAEDEITNLLHDEEALKQLGIRANATVKPITNPKFTDLQSNNWAYKDVIKAAQLGLINGMPDGSFKPNASLQTAEAFTLLDKVLLGNGISEMRLPKNIVEKYMTDKEHWGFLQMASIGSKLKEGTLEKVAKLENRPISRELLAEVIYETTDGKLQKVKEAKAFKDIKDSPYKEALDYVMQTGLMSGVNEEMMQPNKTLTRAECACIVVRLNELLSSKN